MSMEKPRRSGAPPQNYQTDQNAVGETLAQAKERFGRIPLRTYDALEEDSLDFGGFGLLCWLEGRANYGKNPPQVIGTLARIKDAVGWPWSDEALRSKLASLKADGWIDFEMKQGSRAPYVIKLLKCRVNFHLTSKPLPSDFQVETPSSLELTSKQTANDNSASGDEQTDSQPLPFPSTPSPQRAEEQRAESKEQNPEEQESRTAESTGGSEEGSKTTSLGVTPLGGLGPEVEAAMERARAAQKSRT
jgi:hypothetical protein